MFRGFSTVRFKAIFEERLGVFLHERSGGNIYAVSSYNLLDLYVAFGADRLISGKVATR
jgi:hypothetical protein